MRKPRSRFTLRQLMITVAIICVALMIPRWLFLILPGNDTVYSVGYRETAWINLRDGMTTAKVESALGQPLKIVPYGNLEVWRYGLPLGDSHYWKRDVYFRAGVVEKFDGELYRD